ncbi:MULTISPECIES: L,D-transpeptidase [Streptomyces]|uniref:L,D-transpeptidase n=1 Tax=Streptomyces TaxID=1883 RepID=UPI000A392140|nr:MULTISPECIES: L,D-transpeptidase [Streptomyces]MDX3581207.1 L,D-transpeptidase [Streptomyces europaeiscabiei]MDX3619627.1 L,D-transpeptidase [Streptomyces europaeiscabiei]WUD34136.1 L,D-transpeptidase [Streptomyces europaeiscabiei]
MTTRKSASGKRTTRGRTTGTRRARRLVHVLATTAACAVALTLTGCAGIGEGVRVEGPSAIPKAHARADAETGAGGRGDSAAVNVKPSPTPLKAFDGARVNIADGQTVGVGMPISVTFDRPVPESERAAVERRLKVGTSTATEGSWSWVKDRDLADGQRVDYRPRTYWKPGTEVTVRIDDANLTRHFTIGRSLIATVDVGSHTMTVVKDGSTQRIPVTAGAPGMETWNGTMVVSDKQRRVFMDSRSVGYGDSYADWYAYAVHLTASGTYLHENPKANTYAGRQNVTHGCVGLADDGTAKRFYDQVIPGDVVKVTGSKETVAVGNGYGDWNLDWERWKAGSALR